MRRNFVDLLDPHRASRSRPQLDTVLARLAASLAETLGCTFDITDWTVDPTCEDNGVDVRFGHSQAVGSAAGGVIAYFHRHGESASAWAYLLSFDERGHRLRPSQQFLATLTPSGWALQGWQPDAHYEWDSYTSDDRWRQTAVKDEGPANQHEETVARLAPQISLLKDGLAHGRRPSELVAELSRQGLGVLELIVVAREATGLGIAELKSLGGWWRGDGIAEPESFDAEVHRLLSRN